MIIRSANAADVTDITTIYGHHVLHGLGTFEEIPPDGEDMAERIARVSAAGLPWLVASDHTGVLGYAYAGPFRARAAYRFTVEDSVYVAPQSMGRGLGRDLLAAVITACETAGMRQMLAVIGDSANAASIGLHASLGFTHTGVATAVGFKHDRWVDIVFMQRALGA